MSVRRHPPRRAQNIRPGRIGFHMRPEGVIGFFRINEFQRLAFWGQAEHGQADNQ
jgi:hypothetical protein